MLFIFYIKIGTITIHNMDIQEEIKKMRTFKYASNYQILYSLFNGNENDYIVNWEIEKAIKCKFSRVINKQVFNFLLFVNYIIFNIFS